MDLKRISRGVCRFIEQPKVMSAKFKGISSCHSFSCLTAKDLLGTAAKTVIDIGANEGSFIAASKYVFPQAKIYAFEPQEDFFNKIKNIPNVTAFDFGLWDKEGVDVFYKNKDNFGASSFLKPTEVYDKNTGSIDQLMEIQAKRKRFDKLGLEIIRPCFVKIDVEGAEDRVIKGFGSRLKEVDVLQMEWFFKPYHEKQMKLSSVMSILEKNGFTGFIQREVVYVNNSPSVCDLIFFKEKKE